MTKYFARMIAYDDAITFEIPDLPGFFVQTEATDPTDAISEAERVLSEFTGAILDSGRGLPKPASFKDAERKAAELLGEPEAGTHVSSVVLTARPTSTEPVRVNVSIDRRTLAMIDKMAAARGLTRSAYLAEAAHSYG